MRFPVSFGPLKPLAVRAGPRRYHRIIGALGLLAIAGLLQACSVMKIFYNQAPDFAYWYLDGYLNLTDAQSLQLKESLNRLQTWHRQSQLPSYVDALHGLQQQATSDITASAACAVFAEVRRKLVAVSDKAEPMAAALVGTLKPDQLKQLERTFAKNNAKDEQELSGNSFRERQEKRVEQARDRAEKLYGPLEDRQMAVLNQQMKQSGFDARMLHAEQQRRQRDTLQTLLPLAAGQSSTEQAQAALRGLMERTLNSPNPLYRGYLERMTQEGCQAFAALHNSTTPAQRGKALETLRSYEQDFRTLNAQKS